MGAVNVVYVYIICECIVRKTTATSETLESGNLKAQLYVKY